MIATAPEAPPKAEQAVIQRPLEAPPPPVLPPPPAAPLAPAVAPVIAEAVVDQSELRRGFVRGVAAAVARHRNYPQMARRKGWQGEVQLRVLIGAAGQLVEVGVQQSSGYEVLDKEAMEMVRRAAPFPLLVGMKREEFPITLPVAFRLESP
ncbi:MAG: energy transducer TonB [Rhodocyclaceae bacterium]|nr:energy transducer TonB [Rhodocyclaceae bacterium]